MEGLINKLKKHLVSKIQNIKITNFAKSLIVKGKGVVKSITVHSLYLEANDELMIIIDDESPLAIKLSQISTSNTYQGSNHLTLNEAIQFDKKFEIKIETRSQYIYGFVTYTIE